MPQQQRRRTRQRWPAFVAIIAMLALYALTPENIVPRWVLIAISALIIVAMLVINPRRVNTQEEWTRWLAIILSFMLVAANLIDVYAIVLDLLNLNSDTSGPQVLLFALQVWIANVVAFAVVYWELDRGGPVARATLRRDTLPAADFKFTQDDDNDAVLEVKKESSEQANWRPGFIDYFYFSASNMMAFSPTDVMPLTPRAKVLMLIQAFSGFVLLALVIARSVNILA